MNMENVIIYYRGNFFDNIIKGVGDPDDPQESFWGELKNLAFGMDQMVAILQWKVGDEDEVDELTWSLRDLQAFPALQTLTVVFDPIGRKVLSSIPSVNGSVAFGPAINGSQPSGKSSEWLHEWT